jgi:hypothetical protein
MTMNRQFRLAARPVGLPKATDWQLTEEAPAPLKDGEVRVRVLYLSLDPAMRGWMNEGKSYIRPVAIGEVMRAGGVGIVEASNSPHAAVGRCGSRRRGRAAVRRMAGRLLQRHPRTMPSSRRTA